MKRRAIVIFLIVVGALMAGYGTAYVASEDVRYITRAGFEQTHILQARRPISKILADPKTDAATRGSLELVLAARDFAAQLDFEAKDTYTTYSDIGRDTLLVVLSASPKNCLCPYTWKYPIVGRIPYKGFFDPAMARKETSKLDAMGYDTYLRPAAAFSTLGWFNDPLLSTALTGDSVELASTVFHEIAHNTLYVKSATPFNESYAQFVGYHAAEAFFRDQGDSLLARRAADRWHDEIVLGEFYASLVSRLQTLYGSNPDSAALDQGRADAGAWAREELEGPVAARLRTFTIGRLPQRPVNNARLVGARIYRTRLDLFNRWFEQHEGNIKTSVAALDTLMTGVPGDSAYARLAGAVGDTLAVVDTLRAARDSTP